MSGYSISLYKFMQTDENLHKKNRLLESRKEIIICQDSENDKERHKKYLAYGEFDRIGFERVEKFSKFRDVSENARKWVGDRQTHLIYSICRNEKENDILYKDGKFYERQGNEELQSNRLFLGISILQMKYSEKEQCTNMNEYLRTCRVQILDLVKQSGLDVKCTVMGTLGSFGLTILWLADQYTDVLSLLTKIRNTDIAQRGRDEKSIFFSSYTIFAQNHKSGDNWDARVSQIQGTAIVNLTLKKGINKEVCAKISEWQEEDSMLYHSAGEHDITIHMKASKAFTIFNQTYDLNFDSDFYKKYILQSTVKLCEIQSQQLVNGKNLTCDPVSSGKETDVKKDIISELDKIIANYQKLREKFAEIFPSTAGMVDTLDMLFGDYISKVSSDSNELWVETFSHQFLNVLECIHSFCEKFMSLDMPREKALRNINDLLCDFERQISHIAESNNLFLGTPVCQFRYSGQNNLTLYAYFGLIKHILEKIYAEQDVSRQDEIVPLIVADIVPIIQSTMYIDYKDNQDRSKIITINLPMVALYNPVCYYPYLYHEIFHYIVPKDRYVRNKIIGSMISMEVLSSVMKMLMYNHVKSESQELFFWLGDFTENHLMPYIYRFILENYNHYISCDIDGVLDTVINYNSIRDKELVAGQYEQKLFEKWVEWLNAETGITGLDNNLAYKFMCFLYEQKNNLKEEIISWMNNYVENPNMNEAKEIILEVLAQINALVENPEPIATFNSFLRIISRLDETVFNEASIYSDALKETMADIAMVNMGAMDPAEYLLLFTKTKKDLLMDKNQSENVQQDILRVGIVLDYLCKDDPSALGILELIDRIERDYLHLYCGMFFSNHQATEIGYDTYSNALLKDGETWFVYWKECCIKYMDNYSIYSLLIKELGAFTLAVDEVDSTYWKRYAEKLRNLGYQILETKDKDAEKRRDWVEYQNTIEQSIFSLNIEWIHAFQSQSKFSELDGLRRKKIDDTKGILYDKKYSIESKKVTNAKNMEINTKPVIIPNWEYTVGSVGEISTIIAGIAETLAVSNKKVLGKREYPLWYRGQVSDKYPLLPSVMRKYEEKRMLSKEKNKFWLAKLLKQEYEEFKFRADGSPEAVDRVGYTEGDYIALMQHYSVASNFLDWTEDALSALYFALEGFLDPKVKPVDENAAVYIFSPALYNHARVKILSHESVKQISTTVIENKILKIQPQDNIPNMTVSYNTKDYYMYLLGEKECDEQVIKPYKGDEDDKDIWKFYVPMAIYVSRLNDRIRAQSGIFMAYNVYTKPDAYNKFDYIALEKIQENYLKEFSDDRETCPFLYKVVIEKGKRKEIADWVNAFGMSKEKCYPELDNIGARVMR